MAAQVFLRRQLVDHGEKPQQGPAHGEDGHDCRCHGSAGHECQYENKYEKVMGELDELRAQYSPIKLNAGTPKEVTVLLERATGSFDSPMVSWRDMPVAEAVGRGILVAQTDRPGPDARVTGYAHFLTGEMVEAAS